MFTIMTVKYSRTQLKCDNFLLLEKFFRLFDGGFIEFAWISDGLHWCGNSSVGCCLSGHLEKLCAGHLVMVTLNQFKDLSDLLAV